MSTRSGTDTSSSTRYFYTRFEDNNLKYMTVEDATRFSIRAVFSLATVPLPWQMASTTALALLPEQVIWYAAVLASMVGLVAGLRRDMLLTLILAANIALGWFIISLHNGNIGTLVRIRDMVVPFVGWLASLGVCSTIEWIVSTVRSREARRMAPAPAGLVDGVA